jgi:hypothetical protein
MATALKHVEKFTGKGWDNWAFVFRLALKGLGKWFVFTDDPTLNETATEVQRWSKTNDQGYTALVQCMKPEPLQFIKEFEYCIEHGVRKENPRSAR